jgi:hypothetical protein
VHNAYLNLRLRVSDVVDTLRIVHRKTGARNITTGMDLIFFKDLHTDELESLSILVTLLRCIRDGTVAPAVDIEELYSIIARAP